MSGSSDFAAAGLWREAQPLLLASESASRRMLLAATGLPFEAEGAGLNERLVEAPLRAVAKSAAEIAAHLAHAKAAAVAAQAPGRLVLGADQTLALDERMFTKPQNRSEAAAQLALFSGRTHSLHSALCLMRGTEILFECVPAAHLTCRRLSADFIEAYLDAAGDRVLASVGAYQLEGLGIHLFERIEGDHFTILGLPILPLLQFLRSNGSLA